MSDENKKPLGARSRQHAALCIWAVPSLLRLGMKPSKRMIDAASWGAERGVTASDYNPKGVR